MAYSIVKDRKEMNSGFNELHYCIRNGSLDQFDEESIFHLYNIPSRKLVRNKSFINQI